MSLRYTRPPVNKITYGKGVIWTSLCMQAGAVSVQLMYASILNCRNTCLLSFG